MKDMELFTQLPFFQGLESNYVDKVKEVAQIREYREGEVIFDYDVEIDTLYILSKGKVRFVVPIKERELKIYEANGGDIFGLSSILPPGYKTTFKAVSDGCSLLELKMQEIEPYFASDERFRYSFYFNILGLFTRKKDRENHLLVKSLLNLPPIRDHIG